MRIGLVQHAHPLPPSAPFAEQLAAAHARVAAIVAAAGAAGVQVLCLQEVLCAREGFTLTV